MDHQPLPEPARDFRLQELTGRVPAGEYGLAPMPERIDVDVCVVGAGYAGLTAARRLHQNGKSVAVLEARDRVGGRIWTQPLSDGTPVDRGGAWLGPAHDAMFGLAREMGVSTYKTWVKGKHLLIDGDRTRRYPVSSRRSARSPSARSRGRS